MIISTVIGWSPLLAQSFDTSSVKITQVLEDLIQAYVESRADDGDFDFNTLMDRIEQLKKHPIRINDPIALDDFVLLRPSQILALKNYISIHGDLISSYELQVVPEFDEETIRMITPFIRLGSELDDYQVPLKTMLLKSDHQLFLRSGRFLETRKGDTSGYQGGPNRFYLRYRQTYENKLSIGITAEKDPGESFFRKSNARGFDYFSFHAAIRKINKYLEEVVLGDYSVSLGQGLLIHSGFGVGKSPWSTNIRRGERSIRPYTSVNESLFFRGAAFDLRLNKYLKTTVFGSIRHKDGNVLLDSLDRESIFSSFQASGYHRTAAEINDEKKISERIVGGAIQYKRDYGHIGLNMMYSQYDKSLQKSDAPYNQFSFNGTSLAQWSIDHSYQFRNFNFFGEIAGSRPGGLAMIQGLQLSLDKKIDLAILYRGLSKSYAAIYSNSFSENTLAQNEQGLYIGTEIRPAVRWKVAAYWDIWHHPWLRFAVQGPSQDNEQKIRITYSIRRKMEVYLQVRNKWREDNDVRASQPIRPLQVIVKQSMRGQLAYHINTSIESRTRIELSRYGTENRQTGWMIYQDILYDPLESPLSFTTRLAWYHTQSYDSGIYAYENDLLYNFYVPNYNGQGLRTYLNVRYDGIRHVTLEARYALTRLNNVESIGSGLDEISGNKRSEVKFQIRYSF